MVYIQRKENFLVQEYAFCLYIFVFQFFEYSCFLQARETQSLIEKEIANLKSNVEAVSRVIYYSKMSIGFLVRYVALDK